MMPNIVDGGDTGGLMRYLVGPGRANEHVEPHLVAGSRTIMNRWGDWSELSLAQASEIANYLDSFMHETERFVSGPIRKFDPEMGKTRVADYGPNHVWHCSLSLSPDEGPLSEDKWAAIARDFMDEMEFTAASGKAECRWVAIHHGTSKNGGDHIHIAANIVREDGTRWNSWNDQPRSQRTCNMLEHKYGLRIVESREHARSSKCDSAQALNAARRAGKHVTDRAALESRLRAASKAATSEVDFIARARGLGVRLRPRFAKGRTDVVVGYSAALHTKPGVKTQWYAGGSIARDLTLRALRDRWPDTIESATDAVGAWQDAWKGMPLGGGRRAYTREEWLGYKRGLDIYRNQLSNVDPTDRLGLANATNDVAGLLAAAAQQPDLSDEMRGALDYCARQVGRSGQLKHRPAHKSGTSPWVVLGARLLSTAVTPKNSEVSYALALVATMELVKALADLYRQARQANTAAAMLRDTQAVYERVRMEAPYLQATTQLQAEPVPLQQDTLPAPTTTPEPILSPEQIIEPAVARASVGEEAEIERIGQRRPWLATSQGFTKPTEHSDSRTNHSHRDYMSELRQSLFQTPAQAQASENQGTQQEQTSTSGTDASEAGKRSKPPLPGIGEIPQIKKVDHPTRHPNMPTWQPPERGRGRSR